MHDGVGIHQRRADREVVPLRQIAYLFQLRVVRFRRRGGEPHPPRGGHCQAVVAGDDAHAPHAVAEAVAILHLLALALGPGPELQVERFLIGIGEREDAELVVIVQDVSGVPVVSGVEYRKR